MSMNAPQSYRVLVIDDNRAIHDDFRKTLARRPEPSALSAVEDALFGTGSPAAATATTFEIDSALQGEEGLARVKAALAERRPYSVAFVDMRMPPGWDGLRTIRELWRIDPTLNVVICTAFSDHSWAEIEAIDEKGDRLLVLKKPFEPIEVRRLTATLTAKWTLSRQAAMKMDELKELVEARTRELNFVATHDKLTGLPNRALFHERLTQALAQSKRQDGAEVAVLFLDFDRFKIVNDSLGHEGGDALLRSIGKRLQGVLRETDTVTPAGGITARLGGDEFCVLLTGLHQAENAATVARRMLGVLAEPYDICGCRIHSTASIGIAVSSPTCDSAEDLIRDADTAMYRAKADGRGRFVIFDSTMHDAAMRRLLLESELRLAVERGELRVAYQPIVGIETAKPAAAEALVRWQHPTRGLLEPAEFLSVAEECGLIGAIGTFIFETAARQCRQWADAHPDAGLSMHVNVSAKQLFRPDFVDDVKAVLDRTGCDARLLVLEITEGAVANHAERSSAAIRSLRALGLRVILDDFGTGCSSLSLLHTISLDGLKMDRVLIREATKRRAFAAILHAVANLAANLDMCVVAEGVETVDELIMLQTVNCGHAQGHLFARPMTAEEFERRMLVETPDFTQTLASA